MHTFKNSIAYNYSLFQTKSWKEKVSTEGVCVYLRSRVRVVVFGGGLLQHGTELPGQLVGCSQRRVQVIIYTLDWIQTTKSSIEKLTHDNTPRCTNMHSAEMKPRTHTASCCQSLFENSWLWGRSFSAPEKKKKKGTHHSCQEKSLNLMR